MARPRTDIQPRIIASARRSFARTGVDGSSLRQIAKGAKTSIGMIYYYFPTKDDLFHAAVEEVYTKLLAEFEQILGAPAALEERIVNLYSRIGATSELELLTLRLVLQEMLVSKQRRAKLIERFQRGHLGLVLKALHEGVQRGQLRADVSAPVLLVVTLAIGSVPQLVLRAIGAASPFGQASSGANLAHELLGVWLRGVGLTAKDDKTARVRQ